MLKFIGRRLFYMCLSMIVISIVLFLLFRQMPGDPVLIFMADRADGLTPAQWQAEYDAIKAMLHLDGPIWRQYLSWFTNYITGNWGHSMIHRRPVLDVIRVPIGWTMLLNITAITIGFIITVPLGIISAVKRGKLFDKVTMVFTTIGFSMPTFLVAILFIILFAVFLQWLPISGMISPIPPTETMARFFDRLRHMALPIMTVTFISLAGLTRYMRAAMCDALSEDYVRTARAKGLREKVVVYSHAFRNALVPIVTVMTGTLMGLLSGSVIIESIFNWSGMGTTLLHSITGGDYAVAKAISVLFSAMSLVSILVMDLMYGLVDPRIKVRGE